MNGEFSGGIIRAIASVFIDNSLTLANASQQIRLAKLVWRARENGIFVSGSPYDPGASVIQARCCYICNLVAT